MNRLLLFNHVPKCGGTSLRNWFRERFPSLLTYGLIEQALCKMQLHVLDEYPGDLVLTSHYLHLLHIPMLNHERFWLTFLRDPFDTAWSYYNYVKQQHDVPWDMTFYGFVKAYNMDAYYANYFGEGEAHAAIDTLVQRYSFVGVVEQYDFSMGVLAKMLGVSYTGLKKENVVRNKVHRGKEECREVFRNCAPNEYLVYEQACALLASRSRETGVEEQRGAESAASSAEKKEGYVCARLDDILSDEEDEAALHEYDIPYPPPRSFLRDVFAWCKRKGRSRVAHPFLFFSGKFADVVLSGQGFE